MAGRIARNAARFMVVLWLLPVVWLPATAADYVIFGPNFRFTASDPQWSKQVLARARDGLAKKPAAVAHLHVEGVLPSQAENATSLGDMSLVLDLALAWRISGDRRFLEHASEFIDSWVTIYTPAFNPIDETRFDSLLIAYDVTRKDLPKATRAKADDFVRRMATGYIVAMETKQVRHGTDNINWQSHRIKLATLAAFQTGDRQLIERAHQLFNAQLAANLRPDGTVLDYRLRDALHYVVFDLEPLLTTAFAAKVHGYDWYSWRNPDGMNLTNAVDWLVPYARGEQTHIEFAKSVVPFDRERAAAGLPDYQQHVWEPANAVNVFTLATLVDARYRPLRDDLMAKSERQPAAWTALFDKRQ